MELSFEKCAFIKKQVQYLGHLISGEGIEPVPEKLQSLREMTEPTTPKGVKQYLGFVGYYRKFFPKYSDIAKPLTELTKQDTTSMDGPMSRIFQSLERIPVERAYLEVPRHQ